MGKQLFGKHKIKVNIDNPVIAWSREIIPAVSVDMLSAATGEPVKVELSNVSWFLSEATENGSSVQYLVGMPMREEAIKGFNVALGRLKGGGEK